MVATEPHDFIFGTPWFRREAAMCPRPDTELAVREPLPSSVAPLIQRQCILRLPHRTPAQLASAIVASVL